MTASLAYTFSDTLLHLYLKNPPEHVLAVAKTRLAIVGLPYFLCGIMDVMVGSLRGLGYSFMPMIVSMLGACGLRVLWIFTVFQWDRQLSVLYWSYPLSWFVTAAVHFICYCVVKPKRAPVSASRT